MRPKTGAETAEKRNPNPLLLANYPRQPWLLSLSAILGIGPKATLGHKKNTDLRVTAYQFLSHVV